MKHMNLILSALVIMSTLRPSPAGQEITPNHPALNYKWSYTRGGPVQIRPEAIMYLKADMADYNKGVKENKNNTGVHWQGRDKYLSWVIRAEKARSYVVMVIAGGDSYKKASSSGEIAVIGPPGRADVLPQNQVTLRYVGRGTSEGTLNLPAGVSKIQVRVVDKDARASLFGVELVAEDQYPAWKKRLEKFRQSTDISWLSEGTYGIRTAPKNYPPMGEAWSFGEINRRFDAVRHADLAEEMGTAWVTTIHWAHWRWPAPLESIDKLSRGYTYKRDILGEIASELHKRDIRWVLYYHPGHAYGYRHQYYGRNRNDWLKNFVRVVTEIGSRYGEKLDGFGFDEGRSYYPAPFEVLAKAAKTGNPKRYVQWNPWILPPVTLWSSVHEGEHGASFEGQTDRKGRFTEGPFKGMVAAAGWPFEKSGWFIKHENQWIGPPPSKGDWMSRLERTKKRNAALFPTLPMYCDGSVSPYSYAVMVHSRRKFRGVSDRQLLRRRGERGGPVRLCSLVAPSVLQKDKQEAANQAHMFFRQAGHQLARNKPAEASNLLLWVVNHYPNTTYAPMSLKWLMDHPLEGIPLVGVELPDNLADWPEADYSGKLKGAPAVPPTAAEVRRRKAQEMYDKSLEAEQTGKPDQAAEIMLDIIRKYPETEHAQKAREKIIEMYAPKK